MENAAGRAFRLLLFGLMIGGLLWCGAYMLFIRDIVPLPRPTAWSFLIAFGGTVVSLSTIAARSAIFVKPSNGLSEALGAGFGRAKPYLLGIPVGWMMVGCTAWPIYASSVMRLAVGLTGLLLTVSCHIKFDRSLREDANSIRLQKDGR